MPHRLLQTPITDWTVATFGTAAVTIAQAPDPSGLWSVTGMSSVVAVLLWLQYKREERLSAEQSKRDEAAAAREAQLLKRMSEIESTQAAKLDRATDKLLDLTAQQITATSRHITATEKIDDCLLSMSKVLTQLTQGQSMVEEGQMRVHELLKTICTERPCLINADKDVLHEIMQKAKERGTE